MRKTWSRTITGPRPRPNATAQRTHRMDSPDGAGRGQTPPRMRHVASLGGLVLALWAGTSAAGPWRGYASATTGFILDHTSGIRAMGGALQLYVGAETPFGLSLGLVGEG